MECDMQDGKTFEETYRSQPFAELVRLAMALGKAVGRSRRSEKPLPGQPAHA